MATSNADESVPTHEHHDRAPPASPEDAAARVAAGDARAFAIVVDAHGAALYRMVCRVLGDEAQAEDVLQEALVRAYQSLRAGRWRRDASLYTWLYRIAANGALDALRASRRGRAAVERAPAPAVLRPEEALEARVALGRLGALLDALPAEQRIALVLKELEGLSAADVAAALGISEGAVEQRLVRARATLRERMKDV